MKQPKKLTRNQKEYLVKIGYDPEEIKDFRFREEDLEAMLLENIVTKEQFWVEKNRRTKIQWTD